MLGGLHARSGLATAASMTVAVNPLGPVLASVPYKFLDLNGLCHAQSHRWQPSAQGGCGPQSPQGVQTCWGVLIQAVRRFRALQAL